jgi:dolichol kinase
VCRPSGDSMGAIVGSFYGVHRWPASNKTFEGSSAAFFGILLVATCFELACVRAESCGADSMKWPNCGFIFATFLACVLEASTEQIDNLVLPPFYYALLVVSSTVAI